MTGFRITGGRGFHITFENDVTVSVQFGPGNYCEHYDAHPDDEELKRLGYPSYDAEVAVFYSGCLPTSTKVNWLTPAFNEPGSDEYGDVVPRQSPSDVLMWLKLAESLSKEAVLEYFESIRG